MTPEAKDLLSECAEREHRSMASMVEHMVYVYAKSQDIAVAVTNNPVANNKNINRKS
jgi:hypothetical protein